MEIVLFVAGAIIVIAVGACLACMVFYSAVLLLMAIVFSPVIFAVYWLVSLIPAGVFPTDPNIYVGGVWIFILLVCVYTHIRRRQGKPTALDRLLTKQWEESAPPISDIVVPQPDPDDAARIAFVQSLKWRVAEKR